MVRGNRVSKYRQIPTWCRWELLTSGCQNGDHLRSKLKRTTKINQKVIKMYCTVRDELLSTRKQFLTQSFPTPVLFFQLIQHWHKLTYSIKLYIYGADIAIFYLASPLTYHYSIALNQIPNFFYSEGTGRLNVPFANNGGSLGSPISREFATYVIPLSWLIEIVAAILVTSCVVRLPRSPVLILPFQWSAINPIPIGVINAFL